MENKVRKRQWYEKKTKKTNVFLGQWVSHTCGSCEPQNNGDF